MNTSSASLDPVALVEERDAALDAALAGWSDTGSDDALLGAMRDKKTQLGLDAVFERLGEVGDSRGPAGLMLVAQRMLAGEVPMEDALRALRAGQFNDRHRAIAALYASAVPAYLEDMVDFGVLRLVGDTAADPELAARAYFRLGERSSFNDEYAAHSLKAAFDKAGEAGLRSLQADCLIGMARHAMRMNRPAVAADHAELAKEVYEKEGDADKASNAAIVEAVNRLESRDPVGAAAAARPVVQRQMAQGVRDGEHDASVVLSACIREAAKPALQQALAVDAAAVKTYDDAMALAGDSGYRYPDEVADRTLLGRCLVRGDDPAPGARQLALAVETARERESTHELAPALTALGDWLVHTQDPGALECTTEAVQCIRDHPDQEGLAEALVLFAAALRQAKKYEEAVAAYAEAGALEFRVACQAGMIMTLLEAGRDAAAVEAVDDLCNAIAEHGPESAAGDDAHIAVLTQTLVARGHPGAAARLRETLNIEGQEQAALLGSKRNQFFRRAQQTLAGAGAQLAAGNYAAVVAAVEPIAEEARALGELGIELPATYMLGENALMAGRFDEAVSHLQTVITKSKEAEPRIHAAALNKLGTVYATGLKKFDDALVYQVQAIERQRELEEYRGLVVSLVQAAQTCVALGRLDQAGEYADEIRELGHKYPPQDVEWITFVPALVDAHRGRWDLAKPGYRATIAELERKRSQFTTAAAQRQWCEAKALMYGNAVEAAIVASEGEEAITYLELARNRYLDGVAREHGVAATVGKGVAPERLDQDGFFTSSSLADLIGPDSALVWCGGFPRGLGVVAAWRDGGDIAFASSFDREITEQDLVGLFHGDVSRIMAARDGGRGVELVLEMALQDRDVNLGANPYWQGHGEDWNRSMAGVVESVERDIWPRILDTVGRSVPHVVLLPSIGCSELPLSASAPERWPDGTPLATSVAPGVDALPSGGGVSPDAGLRLSQVVNPSEDPALVCCPVEAGAVRDLFDPEPRVLRGRRASVERVAEAIGVATVFHFMGHAFCDWRDPLDSGLLCAKRKQGVGILTVRELFDRVGTIRTPLIVLSACQIGNVEAGDKQNDFLNLPSALVAAGARTVVAPRWLVDDVAASMLLADMLRRWRREGLSVAAALVAARRWLRDEVTRTHVERWLERDAGAVDDKRLDSLRQRYVETFGEDDRPFSSVAHWGAFEITGDPNPFGAVHA